MQLTEQQKKEFIDLLQDETKDENDVQDYLEKHSYLLPKRFKLNHDIHLQSYISKLPIGTNYKTDFVYITKSSAEWNIVLVEIENPQKKFFTTNENLTKDFTQAYGQILAWKNYIEQGNGKAYILEAIDKLLVPIQMKGHPKNFKYLLVYGRSNEILGNAQKTGILAQYRSNNVDIICYDSLISQCENEACVQYMILSPRSQGKFEIKEVPLQPFSTTIFSELSKDVIHLNERISNYFKSQDYSIDKWHEGKYLVYNNKYVSVSDMIKDQTNPHPILKSLADKEKV